MILHARLAVALGDPELRRLGAGLRAGLHLHGMGEEIRLRLDDGEVSFDVQAPADIVLRAGVADWERVLTVPPPPRFQAFTAFAIANDAFTVEGDPLRIAQARGVLERLFELVCASPAAPAETMPRDIGEIAGRYHQVTLDEGVCDMFADSAGEGRPVLFLHTAGADGRQFLSQLADIGLARGYRMIAPDMPFHGRSLPPSGWKGEAYQLTAARYLGWCSAFIEQVVGERVIVAGGSMGAAMALMLAAERPDLVAGAVAIEPPFRSKGRRNPFQHHVAVHAGLHNPAFVRGLMSPTSPLDQRRRAAWIYAQGAPQVYTGDLAFYSDEFDGAVVAPKIDAARTPVALLCGTYDYSATPEDGEKLAALIPGAMMRVMDGLGHFPMCEHPDLFRPHLVAALAHAGR
ncbi:alpha/beta hydrolase [Bradyrhizobium sp. U87765 SZCCT0131]|uniref:alpha/beta fold hydrolase n=1 Tax=unclassified Bradyrhizobium TaxID=2631580 RepID=UPI001BA7DF47|nr:MULTISPECIES: alpha/beta hydrolase [unclassified Bradyrhizobium]MBR1220395.1 alpha/beta hydrolase [Bradyrhizobium sp. U87765 SZCCT0131]MBR1263150.1 alpha/beta hydrolase [Bradyrhizobium sp. U87765 SZCCT0134]MBR1306967.1 alpha/beta hydrolase [Bradyrhizobium sp. U87765 SZCCT0110]MBR1323466.1 alpha/beta hydrolase [Bradyrhizobium sp. U87765 SZCCT0109]MBR1345921.1 alpha/beta hydrolase [Bradyrhizobium sp. U87765 SZCCT0048]